MCKCEWCAEELPRGTIAVHIYYNEHYADERIVDYYEPYWYCSIACADEHLEEMKACLDEYAFDDISIAFRVFSVV